MKVKTAPRDAAGLAEAMANHQRLVGCAGHEFHLLRGVRNEGGEAMYRCARCEGVAAEALKEFLESPTARRLHLAAGGAGAAASGSIDEGAVDPCCTDPIALGKRAAARGGHRYVAGRPQEIAPYGAIGFISGDGHETRGER